jgi:UDP-3-O-[3-hydroxymyristoyl] N-acetylglucosamine deacetylase
MQDRRVVFQRTLQTQVSTVGVGIHSGKKVHLQLRPAAPNTGIVFRRTDLAQPVDIVAKAENVRETSMSTVLANGDVRIGTVEHLMSALAGLGIDNCYVDVSSEEVPILDGSAAPFVYLLKQAGIETQKAPKRFVEIKQAVEVRIGDKWARFEPFHGFKLDFQIEFDHPAFTDRTLNRAVFDASAETFAKAISRARTFGFMRDIEALRERNLALGGSLDNAVVVDDYRVINEDGLRYADEFVRHKILDAMGDLYLMGPVIGAFSGYKSGHELNNKLARAVFASADNFAYRTFESAPIGAAPAALGAPSFA